MTVGSVYPRKEEKEMIARGRSIESGLPVEITLNDKEILNVLLPEALKIIEAVKSTIEKAPPELVEDISEKGIYMTGGGSLLCGIDRLIQESTGINVMIAQDPSSSVAIGTGKALDNIDLLEAKTRK